jgi:hypothetical protein
LANSEALNPVSAQAILRVKVPDGLDLDAWINDPMPEDAVAFSYDVRATCAVAFFFLPRKL